MKHAIGDFNKQVNMEIRRLRDLNPDIRVAGDGWLKLIAQARVNVCQRLGISVPVFDEVLQSHEVGRDAQIVINN